MTQDGVRQPVLRFLAEDSARLRRVSRQALPLAFVAPALVVFSLLLVYPLLNLVTLSLFEWSGFPRSPMRWVGLENYQRLLLQDRIFWISLRNTVFYAGIVVTAWSTISLGLALLLSLRPRGFTFYRTLFFAPVVLSEVAVAIAWRQILEPNLGILNAALRALGVAHPPVWLGNLSLVIPVLAVINIWQWVGYSMVIYLAGLQTLPPELSEAARIDGAGEVQVARHITLPLIKPFIVLVVTLNMIGALKVFTTVFAITQGGPAHASEVVSTYMYLQAYTFNHQGYASAVAVLLVLLIVLVTVVFRRRTSHVGMAF